jgi:hypothetical protein
MNEENGSETLAEKIKKAIRDDPAFVILAASSLIFATAKFMDSASMAKSRRLSDKQTKYFFKMSKSRPFTLERQIPV